jgi:hypothetical protein
MAYVVMIAVWCVTVLLYPLGTFAQSAPALESEYEAQMQDSRAQATIDSLRTRGRRQEAFRLQEQLIQRQQARREASMRRTIFLVRRRGNNSLADRLENQLRELQEIWLRSAQERRAAEVDRQAWADASRPNAR